MKMINYYLNGIRVKNTGFTLIELLIAAVLAGIITSAAMGIVYNPSHKQLIVQDQVSDMQANTRAVAAELTSKIRMAGYKCTEWSSGLGSLQHQSRYDCDFV